MALKPFTTWERKIYSSTLLLCYVLQFPQGLVFGIYELPTCLMRNSVAVERLQMAKHLVLWLIYIPISIEFIHSEDMFEGVLYGIGVIKLIAWCQITNFALLMKLNWQHRKRFHALWNKSVHFENDYFDQVGYRFLNRKQLFFISLKVIFFSYVFFFVLAYNIYKLVMAARESLTTTENHQDDEVSAMVANNSSEAEISGNSTETLSSSSRVVHKSKVILWLFAFFAINNHCIVCLNCNVYYFMLLNYYKMYEFLNDQLEINLKKINRIDRCCTLNATIANQSQKVHNILQLELQMMSDKLAHLAQMYFKQYRLIDVFNRLYRFSNLFLVFSLYYVNIFLFFLTAVCYMRGYQAMYLAIITLSCFSYSYDVYMMFDMSGATIDVISEARRCLWTNSQFGCFNEIFDREHEMFFYQLLHEEVKIDVGKMFMLNRKSFLKMLSSIFLQLIVLLQFYFVSLAEKKSKHCNESNGACAADLGRN